MFSHNTLFQQSTINIQSTPIHPFLSCLINMVLTTQITSSHHPRSSSFLIHTTHHSWSLSQSHHSHNCLSEWKQLDKTQNIHFEKAFTQWCVLHSTAQQSMSGCYSNVSVYTSISTHPMFGQSINTQTHHINTSHLHGYPVSPFTTCTIQSHCHLCWLSLTLLSRFHIPSTHSSSFTCVSIHLIPPYTQSWTCSLVPFHQW